MYELLMGEDLTVESVYDITQLELDGRKQQGIRTLLFLFAVVGLSILLLLYVLSKVANAQAPCDCYRTCPTYSSFCG
jgi:hypothetical protein